MSTSRLRYDRIRSVYPDSVPVLITALPPLELRKSKFIVPKTLPAGQFLHAIRTQCLAPPDALFLFHGEHLIGAQDTMQHWHARFRDEDGALRLSCAQENVFG